LFRLRAARSSTLFPYTTLFRSVRRLRRRRPPGPQRRDARTRGGRARSREPARRPIRAARRRRDGRGDGFGSRGADTRRTGTRAGGGAAVAALGGRAIARRAGKLAGRPRARRRRRLALRDLAARARGSAWRADATNQVVP